jgi:hypothetical protein
VKGRLSAPTAAIVSIGDVVKNRVEEIEHESEALRDYRASARLLPHRYYNYYGG